MASLPQAKTRRTTYWILRMPFGRNLIRLAPLNIGHRHHVNRCYIGKWWIRICQLMHTWLQMMSAWVVEVCHQLPSKEKSEESRMKIKKQACSTCSSKRSFRKNNIINHNSRNTMQRPRKTSWGSKNIHLILSGSILAREERRRISRRGHSRQLSIMGQMWNQQQSQTLEGLWRKVLQRESNGKWRMSQSSRIWKPLGP